MNLKRLHHAVNLRRNQNEFAINQIILAGWTAQPYYSHDHLPKLVGRSERCRFHPSAFVAPAGHCSCCGKRVRS